jgi:hypothetical protein
MWDTYEEYCDFMRLKGYEPSSKEVFNRDYRRKSEEEKAAEELELALFVSRKKESFRNVEPTLSNYEAPRTTAPMKVNLMDMPKVDRVAKVGKTIKPKKPKAVKVPREKKEPIKRKRKTAEEKEAVKYARLQRQYEKKRQKRIEARIAKGLPPVRTSLKGMSEEEIRAHRARLKREQGIRARERIEKDPELKEKKRQLNRDHQRRHKEKNRLKRAEWVKKNPDKAREYYRKWAEANPEAVKEKQRIHKEVRRADPAYRAQEAANARAYRARKRMSCSAEMSCSA